MHSIKFISCTSKIFVFGNILKTAQKFPLIIKSNIHRNEKNSELNMATRNKNIFNGRSDRFNGITIRSDKQECSVKEFENKLEGIENNFIFFNTTLLYFIF